MNARRRRALLLAAVLAGALGACSDDDGGGIDVAALLDEQATEMTADGGPQAGGAAGIDGGTTTAAGGPSTPRSSASGAGGGGRGATAGGQEPAATPTAGDLEIGVRYLTGVEQLANVLGAEGFSVPDTQAMAQAVIDELNRTGGLAGRRVVPVWHPYDASDPAGTATQEQAACSFFTEDHSVPVVLSPLFSSEVLQTCLAKRGVVLVDQNYGFFDMTVAPDTYFVPGYPDPVRSGGAMVDDLVARGFFGSEPRIGITMKDSPDRHRVAAGIRAALNRHGLDIDEEMRYTADHPDAIESGILRFRATGVTHVFILDIGGLESGVIIQAAEAQGYRPTYALDTRNSLDYLQKNAPPEQLQGSAGLGWFPSSDVGRGEGAEPGPLEQRCAEIMKGAGIALNDSGNDRIAYATCDVFRLVELATDAGGEVAAAAIRAGIESLGEYESTGTFASRFGPGRHDGTTHARRIAFDDDCACYRYEGDLVSIG